MCLLYGSLHLCADYIMLCLRDAYMTVFAYVIIMTASVL